MIEFFSAPATRRGAASRTASLVLSAPEAVNLPLGLWHVMAGDPTYRRRRGDSMSHIQEIKVRFAAPAEGPAVEDLRLRIEAPGVTVPVTRTRFDQVEPGQEVEAAWRWSAPLRRGRGPSSLRLVVEAAFTQEARGHVARDEKLVKVAQPTPPTQDTYLSDLPMAYVVNGYGPAELDMNNGDPGPGDGGPITLDGTVYRKGIGMHANGVIGYHLGGNGRTLTAIIGIDDTRGDAGSVIFRVVGDGRTLYESGVMTGSASAKPINVNVSGIDELELVADATDDGQPHDWANWADAFLKVKP